MHFHPKDKSTGKMLNTWIFIFCHEIVKRWGTYINRTGCQLQPKNAGTGLQKPTLVNRTGNLPKSYSKYVIKMTLKAHICVYTPIPPPLNQNTHGTLNTHMHSHTDASDHYGPLFRQTSDLAFFASS